MTFRLLLIAAAVLGVGLFAACSSSRTYTDKKGDDEYDLGAMSLKQDDLPDGLTEADLPSHEFDNASWVQLFGSDDPEGKQRQLDAQGRIKTWVSTFQADRLGRLLGVTSFSTLYKSIDDANAAQRQYNCGIPLNDNVIPTGFDVSAEADGSTGFFTANYNADGSDPNQADGGQLRDTNFCFRTGRILNVVQTESIPGAEDVALAVRLSDKMLAHVNAWFDNPTPPTAEPSPTDTGTVPAGGTAPANNGTQPAGNPSPANTPAPAGSPTAKP
jgi:hypothetical protein